jgi:Hypothetical glycosyl hydrolase 6/Beta-galactosidase trimerisation domain
MKNSLFSRREFLHAGAVAGTAAAFGAIAEGAVWAQTPAAATASPSRATWAEKPMRWAQLTLVEDDPGKFDASFWLDYFKRTRSDGVCLSGGGCVAYYPTQVPFHHRSAWLNNRDVLGELVEGCRKLNMTVLVRTDPHATYNDAQAAHPDWIQVDAEGKPRRHWASPEMWVTCALGPYNFEFMTAVHKEIMTRYRPDGIFLNRWDGSGMCYCEHCRANFKAASGFDLPRTDDPHDPVRRAYTLWWQQRLVEVLQVWNDALRAINPDSCVIPNNGAGALTQLDAVRISDQTPMLVADRQARQGVMPPWMMGKTAREFRATMGSKPVIGLFGVGLEEPYRWKDSVQSDAEIRIWALEGIANGMRPWFSKFSGTLHDKRWLKGVEELYVWAADNERYLRHEASLARVAIVFSHQTATYYGGKSARDMVENPCLGWCQALVESRIQFEMVHERLLDAEHLSRFRTLILPNIAALSDAQCDQLRAFVKSGGNLIATYETSLYDEWGTRRKDFGLGDLFGVSWTGRMEGPMQNSYLQLEHDAAPNHPLFKGLEDAPRIVNAVSQVAVEPREKFALTPITQIPSYPDLPMEKVYPMQAKTMIAGVYLREHAVPENASSGRVAYFPSDIDRTFWEVLAEDHLKLLRNTVDWATNEAPTLEVTGPGLLDVTAWRDHNAIVIHLVNLTNPMAMKGPYREFFPVGEQRIRLKLAQDLNAKSAHLLVAAKSAITQHGGRELTITVPSILDHEVVVVDL